MKEIQSDDVMILTASRHCRIKRYVEYDNETDVITARNWRRLEADAQAYVEAYRVVHPNLAKIDMLPCPPELAAQATWPAFCQYDTTAERLRVAGIARELGKTYASNHPAHTALEFFKGTYPAWCRGLRLAKVRLGRGEQTTIPRTYRKVFAGSFENGCREEWTRALDESAPGWRDELEHLHRDGAPGIGEVVIFVMNWFGKKRCVVHQAKYWEGNQLFSKVAQNWRELEAPAREAILAKFGTLDTGAITCPPELAARAIWLEVQP